MSSATSTAERRVNGSGRVSQGRVIRSEWTKFRSLRSSFITLLVIFSITVGVGVIYASIILSQWHTMSLSDRAAVDPVTVSLTGVDFAELAVGVLGVLVVTGEYATGMIRASLTAVPKRLPVLWAKIAVFTLAVGAVSLISTFASFFATQAILARQHLGVSISSPGAFRMTFNAFIFLTLVGIMGLALGALVRNTAGAISTLVGILFVVPTVLELLPDSWSRHVGPYTPANAGQAFFGTGDPGHLSVLGSLVVVLCWTGFGVAAAAIRLKRTDA